MKKSLIRLFGIGLVVMLLASMFMVAAPASAGTNSLTAKANADIPSTTGKLIQAGLNIYDIAIAGDGETIYVVGWEAAGSSKMYKSTNAGDTWSKITTPSAVTGNITLVAVGPDDPDTIAFLGNTTGLTTNLTGYVSTNGGSTFSSLGTITGDQGNAGALYDLAIAPLDGSTRYIAAAGRADAATTEPGIFYFNLGSAAPGWNDAVVDASWTNLVMGSIDFFKAIAFSPNFPSDQVMVAVSEETGAAAVTGYARYHIASFNQKKWDANVFSSYPVTIESSTNLTINAVDIALDPEYLGGDDTTRVAFLGMSANGTTTDLGGIYRLKDTALKELKLTTAIKSVAWDGTNLAAGDYENNNVYRCADALASSPTVSTSSGNKEIGVDGSGNDQTIVRWNGTTLVGVKQGPSSAFSRSTDNGKTWNDISLIDNALTTMKDIWVSPDGSVTYLLTDDGAEVALWRQASAWTRVLTIADTTNTYIVRGADSDPDVVYIADIGGTTMYYSTSGGVEKWTTRASRYNVADLAVQDADIAYVANNANDEVSKTTNGGFTWGSDKDSGASGGLCASLTMLGDDQLLLATTTGYVAYTADGNSSWSKVATQLSQSGNTQVTASGLAEGDYIYASVNHASATIQRWEIGQSGTTWKNLSAPTSTANQCYGIALYDGILYAANSDGTNSVVKRTLEPTTGTPSSSKWSTVSVSGVAFTATPSSMRISSGSNIITLLDATSQAYYTMTDTLASGTVLELAAPAEGFQNAINPVSGNSQDVAFSWSKPTTGTIAYDVRIWASDGSTILTTASRAATDGATPNLLIGPNQSGTQVLNWAPGQTYYWNVRTSSPIYSPWSEKRSFTIEPLGAQVPNVLSPVNGGEISNTNPAFSWSPVAGTTSYEFQLGLSTNFGKALTSETVAATGTRPLVKLDAGMTYFWRVRAVAPVMGDWSAIANFEIAEPPAAAAPPIEIIQTPPPVIQIPAAPPANVIQIPAAPAPPAQIAPSYIWAIIIIGAVLVIAVIVLIVRTRRSV
ncbi:hypothetical protein ACFLWU_06190 [Chloroflexota bacterium]